MSELHSPFVTTVSPPNLVKLDFPTPLRPTVVSFVVFVQCRFILLLYLSISTLNVYESYYSGFFVYGRSLRALLELEDEEACYAVARPELLELIKKWRPRDDAVRTNNASLRRLSFRHIEYPTHGESYLIGDFFIPTSQFPHRIHRVGTLSDTRKLVCGLDRVAKQDMRKYICFGINGESLFELTLSKRVGYGETIT